MQPLLTLVRQASSKLPKLSRDLLLATSVQRHGVTRLLPKQKLVMALVRIPSAELPSSMCQLAAISSDCPQSRISSSE